MCTQKMRAPSYIGDEKITFPPKPDGQTYRQTGIHIDRQTDIQTDKQTDGRTDISLCRVPSLIKIVCQTFHYATNG